MNDKMKYDEPKESAVKMTRTLHKDSKYIKRMSDAISAERLQFKDGKSLGDLNLLIEDATTVRKVRRIVEKRVCQSYWVHRPTRDCGGNYSRYATKRRVANQLKNIYGYVPDFSFAA